MRMQIRFFLDPETGLPHIEEHGVSEVEVVDVLRKPLEEIGGRGGSVIAVGQTRSGRYLRVIYSPDDDGEGQAVASAAATNQEKASMKKTKDPNRYPKRLNRRKVEALIAHYDHQSDEDAIAEAEAAYRKRSASLVEVPVKLLPAVRKLIARRAG
jgi:hypothetical protein